MNEIRQAIDRFGYDSVSRGLAAARKRTSITQRELAQLTGINRSTIAQWELGQTTLSVDDLSKIHAVVVEDEAERRAYFDGELKVGGKWRETLGLSQRQLGELAGVRQATIVRAEQGKPVSVITKEKIRKALLLARDNKAKETQRTLSADPVLELLLGLSGSPLTTAGDPNKELADSRDRIELMEKLIAFHENHEAYLIRLLGAAVSEWRKDLEDFQQAAGAAEIGAGRIQRFEADYIDLSALHFKSTGVPVER